MILVGWILAFCMTLLLLTIFVGIILEVVRKKDADI